MYFRAFLSRRYKSNRCLKYIMEARPLYCRKMTKTGNSPLLPIKHSKEEKMGEKKAVQSIRGSDYKLLVMAFCLVVGLWNSAIAAGTDSTKHWVGTWAAAPYKTTSDAKNKPPSALDDKTLRQIVRVSIGGDTVRVKFSNITCTTPVIMKSVTIAASPDGTKSAVTASTITKLTFKGDSTVTIDAKSEVYSDPVAFNLQPSMRVAITIYYGQCKTPDDMTFHYGSRTNSYFVNGNKVASADLSGSQTIERWYTICGIDVLAPKSAFAVAAIGNSITDGASLSGGLQNRWTDRFSERLLANEATKAVGVLNLGIGATLVTAEGNGAASGVDRFAHDVLGQSGLHWVIILYGVNDINAGKSASVIFNGIKQMADAAHAKDTSIKVYGGTVTPNSGKLETVRSQINDMIRTSTDLDGFIDFAKALQDPSNPSKMLPAYEGSWNDGLHPGPAGHDAMGKCIDLKLFECEGACPVKKTEVEEHNGYKLGGINSNHLNNHATVAFEIPRETFVSLKMYSMLGKEIAELAGRNFTSGKHTVEFDCRNCAQGMYVCSIQADKFSASRKMVFPVQ